MADEPTSVVIFGATGDLTRRKLIPALFQSVCKGRLPDQMRIVGFARQSGNDRSLYADIRLGNQKLV